jgi:hypothetical protein
MPERVKESEFGRRGRCASTAALCRKHVIHWQTCSYALMAVSLRPVAPPCCVLRHLCNPLAVSILSNRVGVDSVGTADAFLWLRLHAGVSRGGESRQSNSFVWRHGPEHGARSLLCNILRLFDKLDFRGSPGGVFGILTHFMTNGAKGMTALIIRAHHTKGLSAISASRRCLEHYIA